MTNTIKHALTPTGFIAVTLILMLVAWDSAAQVAWGTYLGGAGEDQGLGIAVDSSGNVYVTGATKSSGWVSAGWDTTHNGNIDGYVVKFDMAGAHMWSSYLGGASVDGGAGITVDPTNQNVYATGTTSSSNWVSGGWDTVYGGSRDSYIVKLDPDGAHLWSSYIGGSNIDEGAALALNTNGNLYATGNTVSTNWVSGGADTTHNGSRDAYIVKLDPDGAHLWSSYIGGSNEDKALDIAVDTSGNVYTTGSTISTDWVSDGWDTTFGGTLDGFGVKLDPNGAHLWSTYLGGTDIDTGYGIVVDADGNVYATGTTASPDWISGGWDTTRYGTTDDGYLVKLDASSGAHVWSSYLGEAGDDDGYGIALDANGNIYVLGHYLRWRPRRICSKVRCGGRLHGGLVHG